jgi:hypothetical protein
MLRFRYQNTDYQLPMTQGGVHALLNVDENWRELAYEKDGSSLELSIDIGFSLSIEELQHVYETKQADFLLAAGLAREYEANKKGKMVLDTRHLPLVELNLGINYTEWNFENEKTDLIGNIIRYPMLKDLKNLTLDSTICENSTLWFPVMPITTLSTIRFGETGLNYIDVHFAGHSEDIGGKLDFSLEEKQLPFLMHFRTGGYADEFIGMNIAERFAELKACAATVYDMSRYQVIEKIINKQTKSVQIQLLEKD